MSCFAFYCKLFICNLKRIDYLGLGRLSCFFLLYFPCNYVVSVRRGFVFLLVLGKGCVISLWHSLGFPFNYFVILQPPCFQTPTSLINMD